MNTKDIEELLLNYLDNQAAQDIHDTFGDNIEIDANSFESKGVLTTDNGLIVNIGGAEFQITIVRSR